MCIASNLPIWAAWIHHLEYLERWIAIWPSMAEQKQSCLKLDAEVDLGRIAEHVTDTHRPLVRFPHERSKIPTDGSWYTKR